MNGRRPRGLITGGTGFIGSHLAARLLRRGWRVAVLDRSATVATAGVDTVDELWVAEAGDRAAVRAACRGADVVFHLAGSTDLVAAEADPEADLHAHRRAAELLAAEARAARARRIVYLSSGGTVYGRPRALPIPESHPTDPISVLGRRCLAIEAALFGSGLDTIVLRAANVFGRGQRADRGQGLVAVALDRLARGLEVEIFGDGSATRDFVAVEDVAQAALLAADYAGHQRVFNVGAGRGRTVLEVVEQVAAALGTAPLVRHVPSRAFDVPVNVLDNRRARRELGWQPTLGFAERLASLVAGPVPVTG